MLMGFTNIGYTARPDHASVDLARRLDLRAGELVTLRNDPGEELHLFVVTGEVWVTQEGDGADHVAEPGDELCLRRPGRIVVEATKDAVIRAERAVNQAA